MLMPSIFQNVKLEQYILELFFLPSRLLEMYLKERSLFDAGIKGPYHSFCMFEPNIFNFHTCYVTDNHFPKDKTVFQFS
ncbi:hypothetical protein LDENG_00239220 [Lucifuga dentata]|nr:hypothetical protein LDENG_00239220 [Lucifuga dentata]